MVFCSVDTLPGVYYFEGLIEVCGTFLDYFVYLIWLGEPLSSGVEGLDSNLVDADGRRSKSLLSHYYLQKCV